MNPRWLGHFGKVLQFAGLVIPLLAILAQLNGSIRLGQMLAFALIAVGMFYMGRILEGFGASP